MLNNESNKGETKRDASALLQSKDNRSNTHYNWNNLIHKSHNIFHKTSLRLDTNRNFHDFTNNRANHPKKNK